MDDVRNEQLKDMRARAVPADSAQSGSWKDRFPQTLVTISQEAMDRMRYLTPEMLEIKKATGITAEKLTDLDAFREAFGPPKLKVYEIGGNKPLETPPLGKLDQFVELEARYRADIEQYIPMASLADGMVVPSINLS
jgi:hypothetical protein